jgi:hypothetical protein
MSSRFVSAGAIDAATGEAAPLPSEQQQQPTTSSETTTATAETPQAQTAKQAAWAAATAQLEADRRRREEARQAAAAGGEQKSLFDVLQANKAAKQAAFDEAHRLRNRKFFLLFLLFWGRGAGKTCD